MNLKHLVDYFRSSSKGTASLAKERLQIIVSHQRSRSPSPDFLPRLQQELLEVISKYFPVTQDQVKVELERSGEYAVLELNVTLTDLESATEK